jgi:hypothetical protein
LNRRASFDLVLSAAADMPSTRQNFEAALAAFARALFARPSASSLRAGLNAPLAA